MVDLGEYPFLLVDTSRFSELPLYPEFQQRLGIAASVVWNREFVSRFEKIHIISWFAKC